MADHYGDPTGTWDPIDTALIATSMIDANVFDGLVWRSPSDPTKISPRLATSWKFVTPTTVDFNLRQGVTFQDGEPFNAQAVVFTFTRLLGPLGKKGPQYPYFNDIKTVKALSTYKVEFQLKKLDPTFLAQLTGYGAYIVPPKYVKAHTDKYFDTHPVGTGSYRMTKYVKDQYVTLQAYPNYWGTKAKIKNIRVNFVPNPTTVVAEVEAGSVQLAQMIPPSQVQVVKQQPNYQVSVAHTGTVYFVRFDVAHPFVDKKAVRQAINYAVNKKEIIQKILNGYGTLVNSIQAQQSFGYDKSLAPYPYDPTKAKALLKQAGIKPGTQLTFTFDGSNEIFKEIAQAIQVYLQKVGLKVVLKPEDFTTLYTQLVPHSKAGSMYEFFWSNGTLDFDDDLAVLYQKGQFWDPSYGNPQLVTILKEERATNNPQKRLQYFYQADKIIKNDAVDIPLYQEDDIWAVSTKLGGFIPSDTETPYLNRLYWK